MIKELNERMKITLWIVAVLVAGFTYLGIQGQRLWPDHEQTRSGQGAYVMHHK